MASKTIKGLTVEIGGDTTKLGKALEDVEKKSKNLSSELGEVNRLLKMDPGNADLLAQKQTILAEAVENTRKKLDTLKEAEKQVQAQFERGEVSEEQVRALQREIIATTKKMDGYEKAAKETAEAVDKLGDESDEAGDDLGDTGDEAKKSAKKVDDFADKADKAEKSSGKLGSTLAGAAKAGLAAVGAAAGALITGLVASAEATREYRTETGKLETAFTTAGHSTEAATATYKALQGVLGETDQAVEAANHLAKLTDNEQDLQKWTDICTGVYATFGASLPIEGLTEAANETAKTGSLTGSLADALNWAGVSEDDFQASLDACTTEQERQALITETLNSLYSEAADAYRETNAEIIRANEANEAWTASMAEIGGAIEPILTDVKMLSASLLQDLVPGVKSVAEAFRGILNGDVGAAEALGTALSGIIQQIFNMAVDMAPAIVEAAISLLTTLTTTIISMLPQLVTTGVQLILSIIDGLTSAIPQITQAIVDMIPQLVAALVTGIPQLIQGAVQLLLAIVEAIPQIIPPLVEALPQIVMAIINGLLSALPQLLNGAVQFLTAIVQAIPQLINMLVPEIPTIVTTIIDGLIANIPILLEGAIQLLNAIVEAIPLIIEALIPQVPNIVNTIITKLLEMTPVLLDAAVQLLMALVFAIPEIVMALIQNLPEILGAITSVLSAIPSLIWGILVQVLQQLPTWIVQFVQKAIEAGMKWQQGLLDFFIQLPGKLWTQLQNVIARVTSWVSTMVSSAQNAGSKFISTVVSFITQLPGKVWTHLSSTIQKIVQFGSQAVNKAKTAAKNILNAVVDGVKSLPSKMLNIGTDLVKGLWNGISNMTDWIIGKIQGFGDSVLGGIKSFFGIKSPSRVFRDEVGAMLAEGMAKGIEENANAPLDAMADLSSGLLDEADGLNGLTLERKLNTTFANSTANNATSGLLAKMDSILAAIERGQVITIDGKTWVGATADGYDSTLGQRRALVARGAL